MTVISCHLSQSLAPQLQRVSYYLGVALLGGGVAVLARSLGCDPEAGLPDPVPDFAQRAEAFGGYRLEEKKRTPHWAFIWQALHDKIPLLLLLVATLELVVGMAIGTAESRRTEWIEPTFIYITVGFIVNVAPSLDWTREYVVSPLFQKLDRMAWLIGYVGMFVATLCFVTKMIKNFVGKLAHSAALTVFENLLYARSRSTRPWHLSVVLCHSWKQ